MVVGSVPGWSAVGSARDIHIPRTLANSSFVQNGSVDPVRVKTGEIRLIAEEFDATNDGQKLDRLSSGDLRTSSSAKIQSVY
jgi:hypothetical protein